MDVKTTLNFQNLACDHDLYQNYY